VDFRAELLAVPPLERDDWVDRRLGTGDLPADGPLPPGCVPYLPAPVAALLALAEHVRATYTFVDVGAGTGRAAILVHQLTGARVVGLEIQPQLVDAARRAVARLGLGPISFELGDAAELVGRVRGDVYFLYCPFSGPRLAQVLENLARPARVACLDMPPLDGHELVASPSAGLAIYRRLVQPS
jgi:SAM-dependent methyltransferase